MMVFVTSQGGQGVRITSLDGHAPKLHKNYQTPKQTKWHEPEHVFPPSSSVVEDIVIDVGATTGRTSVVFNKGLVINSQVFITLHFFGGLMFKGIPIHIEVAEDLGAPL